MDRPVPKSYSAFTCLGDVGKRSHFPVLIAGPYVVLQAAEDTLWDGVCWTVCHNIFYW